MGTPVTVQNSIDAKVHSIAADPEHQHPSAAWHASKIKTPVLSDPSVVFSVLLRKRRPLFFENGTSGPKGVCGDALPIWYSSTIFCPKLKIMSLGLCDTRKKSKKNCKSEELCVFLATARLKVTL